MGAQGEGIGLEMAMGMRARKVYVSDLLGLAVKSLLENRLRASLTLLGLAIGVMSLITVMTVIQGANDYVATRIANLGSNVLQVTKLANISEGIDAFVRSFRRKDITWDDYQAARVRVGSALRAGARASSLTVARYADNSVDDCAVEGCTASMIDIGTREIEDGRFYTDQEQRFSRRVCVIGWDLRDKLFPGEDPLGKTLKVGDAPYLVVGVCKQLGNVVGVSQDNFVMVPISSFFKQYGQRRSLDIFFQASDTEEIGQVIDEARVVMRALRNLKYQQEDDFTVLTSDSTIDLFHSITDNFFLVFLLLTAVSAVVGGIVIMNIMLVSVSERTMEIGVRRAMGATRRHVLAQFLLESLLLCVTGGVVGVSLGLAAASTFNRMAGMESAVRLWVAAFGVGLSSAIGLFFGIYPAWKAAWLDPIEALRQEK